MTGNDDILEELNRLRALVNGLVLAITRGDKRASRFVYGEEYLRRSQENINSVIRAVDRSLEERIRAVARAEMAPRSQETFEKSALEDEIGFSGPRQLYGTVEVYADSYNPDLLADIEEITVDLGFELVVSYPAVPGSIRKRWLVRTKKPALREELVEDLALLKRALELHHLDETQADIDERYVRMAGRIFHAMQGADNICLKIGALLAIKTTSDGQVGFNVITLTARQLLALQKHPHFLSDPSKTLTLLSQAVAESDSTSVLMPKAEIQSGDTPLNSWRGR